MAEYKVPQDVEAEDKLLGPFSFRQFIYLIIAAAAGVLAWALSRVFLPLLLIPAPITIFFLVLALPLRKDQPMEIYLAAVISYYFKPRKRLWSPDGMQSLVEITTPKETEMVRSKNLSSQEAEQRLSYLSHIVDTEGWAVRGVAAPVNSTDKVSRDVILEASEAEDVLDGSTGVARSFESMLSRSKEERRQAMMERVTHAAPSATTTPQAQVTPAPPEPAVNPQPVQPTTQDDSVNISYNPYPASMHQSVIQPSSDQTTQPVQPPQNVAPLPPPVDESSQTTSDTPVSPDIINLANNHDLSIETIAHEAHRIHDKEAHDDEVMISLR